MRPIHLAELSPTLSGNPCPIPAFCHRCLHPAGTSKNNAFFQKAAGLKASPCALKLQMCLNHTQSLSHCVTWCLSCPVSELLLQDESDNCVIGLLGEFAEVPTAVQLCFLLNKPRSNPLKAQLQDNGSRVVSPTSVFPSLLPQTVPLPDRGSALVLAELPSLLVPFAWLILSLPQPGRPKEWSWMAEH